MTRRTKRAFITGLFATTEPLSRFSVCPWIHAKGGWGRMKSPGTSLRPLPSRFYLHWRKVLGIGSWGTQRFNVAGTMSQAHQARSSFSSTSRLTPSLLALDGSMGLVPTLEYERAGGVLATRGEQGCLIQEISLLAGGRDPSEGPPALRRTPETQGERVRIPYDYAGQILPPSSQPPASHSHRAMMSVMLEKNVGRSRHQAPGICHGRPPPCPAWSSSSLLPASRGAVS